MALTSQGTTAFLDTVEGGEVRSVTVSGDGVNLIDVSALGDDQSLQMTGTGTNPTITVVMLDDAWGYTPTASGQGPTLTTSNLVITYGSGGQAITYYNVALVDYSPSVSIDAAVEHTYTFTSLDNSAS
tara:strand:- start:3321 stop:3704 length:384 start_codon:yes stop_codon:yes gene_type:complete